MGIAIQQLNGLGQNGIVKSVLITPEEKWRKKGQTKGEKKGFCTRLETMLKTPDEFT